MIRRPDEFDATRQQRERQANGALLVIFALAAIMVTGAVWLLCNPEQIGMFAGRIAAGFNAGVGR